MPNQARSITHAQLQLFIIIVMRMPRWPKLVVSGYKTKRDSCAVTVVANHNSTEARQTMHVVSCVTVLLFLVPVFTHRNVVSEDNRSVSSVASVLECTHRAHKARAGKPDSSARQPDPHWRWNAHKWHQTSLYFWEGLSKEIVNLFPSS